MGGPAYQTAREQHAKFLACYRAQRFSVAQAVAKALTSAWDHQLKDYYLMMMERCIELGKNPPGEGWDGVYRATSK
jgi:hypothetical protein